MSSTLSNLSRKFAERISSQLVSFVVSIVLARILAPSDYGAIAVDLRLCKCLEISKTIQ